MPNVIIKQGKTIMANKAIILDTKIHALNDAFIKVAYYPLELSSGFFSFKRNEKTVQFYDPLCPLDAETMARHHVIESDLTGSPMHTSAKLQHGIKYIIGHDADGAAIQFNQVGFNKNLRPINTKKLAEKLIPDLASHDLTTLSYYFAEDKKRLRTAITSSQHDFTNIDLTAALLKQLVHFAPAGSFQSIESLYLLSLECRIPDFVTFGEHKGLSISALPDAYKSFILRSEKLDDWLKLAVQLDNANLVRQTFEITNALPPDTYSNYDFIKSTTPVEADKLQVLESTLYASLGISPE